MERKLEEKKTAEKLFDEVRRSTSGIFKYPEHSLRLPNAAIKILHANVLKVRAKGIATHLPDEVKGWVKESVKLLDDIIREKGSEIEWKPFSELYSHLEELPKDNEISLALKNLGTGLSLDEQSLPIGSPALKKFESICDNTDNMADNPKLVVEHPAGALEWFLNSTEYVMEHELASEESKNREDVAEWLVKTVSVLKKIGPVEKEMMISVDKLLGHLNSLSKDLDKDLNLDELASSLTKRKNEKKD